MIYFYSGTPGSGKSLEVAKDIVNKIKIKKQNVIANIDINVEAISKKKNIGKFIYLDNSNFTPEFLYKYAIDNHVKGKEGQTLLVVDEAQMLFSPTVIKIKNQENPKYRVDWLEFFTQHRHLGYNIILISQFDRLIDAQIRCLFEYNVIHRKVNNFKLGWLFSLFGVGVFCSITYWYGVKERVGSHFYIYRRKYSKIYDSYNKFNNVSRETMKHC